MVRYLFSKFTPSPLINHRAYFNGIKFMSQRCGSNIVLTKFGKLNSNFSAEVSPVREGVKSMCRIILWR